MKAMVMTGFKEPLQIQEVADPTYDDWGAIIRVEANGICRSDWHAWAGDFDWMKNIPLPHVLGHEFCGVVEEVGKNVTQYKAGDRVIVPFTQGDGTCEHCRSGHHNLCDNGQLPGFTYWGGFGRYVSVPRADLNLVKLPDSVNFVDAASLGCRFMTSFHGIVDQVSVRPGEWVAVYGCGGIGLSSIHIASALGANVIAIDINDTSLELAKKLGAAVTINSKNENAPKLVREITKGGTHVSVDALGIVQTCQSAIKSLRKRGRHLQIGLTSKNENGYIPLPIDMIVQKELTVVGAIGMSPSRYQDMLQMAESGKIQPGSLVTNRVSIHEAGSILESMGDFGTVGVTVVTNW